MRRNVRFGSALMGNDCQTVIAGYDKKKAPHLDYHLLHATLGEFHRRAGRVQEARRCFLKAMECTVSLSEQRLLERKLRDCEALAQTIKGE
ncbi:MAG: hypothetical protein DMG14_35045 [Acidobacteria bacterium]|nr:MAG: hypothetical protein DMG14_35045 [Acidobacteriota bacterium]